MKLLHIRATPRDHKSHTLRVSEVFLATLCERYPDLRVDTLDLFSQDLPAVAGENIESKYHLMYGQPIEKHHQESWREIESAINHFLSADFYLISTPMWNFSIPYALKYYIDAIVQPGYLFKYNELGQAIGQVQGRKMVCITSRGANYSPGSGFEPYDFQEPYLRTIFGFVGITDIHFINAQPMDVTFDLREAATASAIAEARALAASVDWCPEPVKEEAENPALLKPPVLPEEPAEASAAAEKGAGSRVF